MHKVKYIGVSLAIVALAACATNDSKDMPPFGGDDSVKYAGELWSQLDKANLAGANASVSKPYQGQHPHGAVLDTIEGTLKVKGHTGVVIVKRNYGGDGVSIDNVANDPGAYLKAVTVMYKREAGYDPEDNDWFWAKYTPDGSLAQNDAGMSLAGRVAKGKPKGCIACHSSAPGGDMVFNNDRYAN